MIRPVLLRRPAARSEEGEAAERVVIFVTAAVGAMVTVFESVVAMPLLVALATLALAATMALRARKLAPWAAMAVWATLLLRTEGWAILPPLLMIVLCLALAVGPDRLLDWVGEEWVGRRKRQEPGGWIEDA